MRVVFSEDYRLHFPQAELSSSEFVTLFARPSRVEYIPNRLKDRGFADIVRPGHHATADMYGGYAVEAVGINMVNVLKGFLTR